MFRDEIQLKVASRGLAAVSSASVLAQVPTTLSERWACSEPGFLEAETSVSKIRLTGSECLSGLKQVEIVNKTNGYTAEVISLKDQTFTTDYIDLSEGENAIELVGTKGDLQIRKSLKVVRRTPASSKISAKAN